jgi:hypothetical protein
VAKYLGDAVLALFGAPVAHENDPERALEAGLDMLRCAAALSEQWMARLGQPVSLHIAVHTGPVVAGSLGDGAGAGYDVTGDTVNTASRLLSEAAPGTILVVASTQALAGHRFAFEPAGTVALRGKSEPMVVHRLLSVLAEPRSARGLATLGLAGPLVGRDDELGRLLSAFDRMQKSCAQLVGLAGDAGTGKSRLIAEFLKQLEARGRLGGVAVRRATCSSLGEPFTAPSPRCSAKATASRSAIRSPWRARSWPMASVRSAPTRGSPRRSHRCWATCSASRRGGRATSIRSSSGARSCSLPACWSSVGSSRGRCWSSSTISIGRTRPRAICCTTSPITWHYLAKAQQVCERAGVEPDALMVLPFLY